MCFSCDNSHFPPDPPETSETTPTPSAPNAAELTPTRASGVTTRGRSRSTDSALYNRSISQQAYHQPAQSSHHVNPFIPLNLSPSSHNSSHPTTPPNQMPSSPWHFTPYNPNGNTTYPTFSSTTQYHLASTSSSNFTQTFPPPSTVRNMYPDIRTPSTSSQRRFQYPQHPPEASPHVERSPQMSTQDSRLALPQLPQLPPLAVSHPDFPDLQDERRGRLTCQICPKKPDLCMNCKKHGLKRCPTPEPQQNSSGKRRRTRQHNVTVVPSSSSAMGYTENPDNDSDINADSTSEGLYSPPPFPPPWFTATTSTDWFQATAVRIETAASTSRPSPYINDIPPGIFSRLTLPSALLVQPASGMQRLGERLHHDGRDSVREHTSPEPASPHSPTTHSQPGSPPPSSPRQAPGS
ncbi:hypothetical protein BD410DRAFT_833209 [Rickenella mellea]|uniref:Uncharacterized protein n=1 Tax=Rickenella mellea TaxID=50990 RepID=A0A4Y7PFY7_9AGAM|nr:hypothetical protein BD410DRAFT_833209 [Rickenella mellea]